MADLVKKKLRKAGDSTRDPADMPATNSAGATATTGRDSNGATGAASLDANTLVSGSAGRNDGEHAIRTGSTTAGSRASSNGIKTAVRSTRGTASKSASKKQRPVRRRGRPRGPERVALSVRVLDELDDRLTQAVAGTDLGPQDILESALTDWLDRNGY